VDQLVYHRSTHQEAADRNGIRNTRANAHGASISTIHHKDAEATKFSLIKRPDTTEVAIRREVQQLRPHNEPKAIPKST
jgi:hypothetical protein